MMPESEIGIRQSRERSVIWVLFIPMVRRLQPRSAGRGSRRPAQGTEDNVTQPAPVQDPRASVIWLLEAESYARKQRRSHHR